MTLQNQTLAFIGAGNMAEALIKGLLAAKTLSPRQLIATDVRPERRTELSAAYGIRTLADNAAAVQVAEIILLAVKPQQMTEVLGNLKSQITTHKLLISIAAGVTTARIERELGGTPRVVRVMPNTPALVGAGAAGLCRGRHATDSDLATAETILQAVGITVRVAEDAMDAVTALSGSGPAYLFYLAETLIAAGVKVGLSPEIARQLAIQTVHGAGKLLAESSDAPEVLRQKVTSPGGTTEAALKVMTERQLADIIAAAVEAATKRGKELSGG